MGEAVSYLVWGCMIGSWLTTIWMMRQDAKPKPIDDARRIMNDAYAACQTGTKFAPDMDVSSQKRITINDKPFLLILKPVKEDA